jgi:hypothetical protein
MSDKTTRERALALFDALEEIPMSTTGPDYRNEAADLIEAAFEEVRKAECERLLGHPEQQLISWAEFKEKNRRDNPT